MGRIHFCLAIVLCISLPVRASEQPAQSGLSSYIDKRTVVGLLSGAFVALGVMAYYKVRAIANYTGNTPLGVIRIGELTTAEPIIQQLENHVRNPFIKGILLLIDSPGGAAGTSYALHHEVLRAKKVKPVIALIENGCYSGGYYVASAAHYIVASGAASIGNIGVISRHYYVGNPQKYELEGMGVVAGGIREENVFAGHSKVSASHYAPLNQRQKQEIQVIVNETYQQLITDIARARNLSLEEQGKWAEGQLFLAPKAKELGLIDAVGTFSDLRVILKPLLRKYGMSCIGRIILVSDESWLNILSKYMVMGAQGATKTSAQYPIELRL
jgi:signal peptide peptidase SppA